MGESNNILIGSRNSKTKYEIDAFCHGFMVWFYHYIFLYHYFPTEPKDQHRHTHSPNLSCAKNAKMLWKFAQVTNLSVVRCNKVLNTAQTVPMTNLAGEVSSYDTYGLFGRVLFVGLFSNHGVEQVG